MSTLVTPSPLTPRWLVRLAVFDSGAAVMVLEILGGRLLAPVFGTTLHVWTALISVTLAALALGTPPVGGSPSADPAWSR